MIIARITNMASNEFSKNLLSVWNEEPIFFFLAEKKNQKADNRLFTKTESTGGEVQRQVNNFLS